MDGALLAAFLAASVLLAVTPGPGVVYIVTRTLVQGRSAGIASVAGVACGNLLNAVGASLGLAALLALSHRAFVVVQIAGAAYLMWLGVQALRSPAAAAPGSRTVSPTSVSRLFRDGLFVAMLNPKTALFFAAFLPQFIDAIRPALPQALGLGAAFVAIAACSDTLYMAAASRLAPWLARRRGSHAVARYVSAGVYVSLGVACAMAGPRLSR